LELPLEVDDEYWETGDNCTNSFKQPPGIPSLIAAFNQFIKLTQIIAFTVRTLVTYFLMSHLPGVDRIFISLVRR
jgi:hypothetical protein